MGRDIIVDRDAVSGWFEGAAAAMAVLVCAGAGAVVTAVAGLMLAMAVTAVVGPAPRALGAIALVTVSLGALLSAAIVGELTRGGWQGALGGAAVIVLAALAFGGAVTSPFDVPPAGCLASALAASALTGSALLRPETA